MTYYYTELDAPDLPRDGCRTTPLRVICLPRGAGWNLVFRQLMFLTCSCDIAIVAGVPERSDLIPANPDEIAEALSFALQYNGRKRVHHADSMMARITADRLVRHLAASGFVLMKGPPALAPSTTGMVPEGSAPNPDVPDADR
jgi:hypothetical protein